MTTKRRLVGFAAGVLIMAATATVCDSLAAAESQRESALTFESITFECWIKLARDYSLDLEDVRRMLQRASPEQRAEILARCSVTSSTRAVDAAAVERGRVLYTNQGCAFCHGKEAQGGDSGPNLLRSPLLMRDRRGETIGEVVLKGRPNTVMRAFALKPEELADIAEFLHSFQAHTGNSLLHPSRSILTGNTAAGKRFFNRQCGQCHSAVSDLAEIASKYPDPQALQQHWLMPQNVPQTATVTSPLGATLQGRVLRIDEFRVLLGFSDGTQRTFDLQDKEARLVIHDPMAEHRALLRTYADRDIQDVTAYLATLEQSAQTASALTSHTTGQSELVALKLDDTGSDANDELPPEAILQPAPGSWPTYSGDYSGRRYSPLKVLNQSNVKALKLAWTTRLTAGPNDEGGYALIVAGEGQGPLSALVSTEVRGSILQVNGVLYLSTPDNAWAVDARTGDVLWHFYWKTKGAMRLGNRGLGMWRRYLYLSTPDDYLVSIDARTGETRWHVEIADINAEYFSSSSAPMVMGNHVLVGSSNPQGEPGFLKSFDPETGELQWVHYSVPVKPGDPGLETWKDLQAARHGGGMVWIPGAYDPETKLYIYGTGNPTPAYFARPRGEGDALYTCSILAVDVDSGKQAWHYQVSPNDTHDWDAGLTPVLADITIDGKPRKVAMVAARNGYFFVIDRTNGEHVLTSKFSAAANWAQPSLNALGQPVRIASKDVAVSGTLVSPSNEGAANWLPASYSPDYGLFYVPSAESWSMYYRIEPDPAGVNSESGKAEIEVDADSYLKAIDPKTGEITWSIRYPSRGGLASGVLTTAGRLLFAGDTSGNLVARDPGTGQPLWHARLAAVVSNAPESYLLDGTQYILVAAGDTLYVFTLSV
jgi:alcohol dehydrogenase (cytochrome c)